MCFFRIKCDWFPNVHAVATLRCLTPAKTSCWWDLLFSSKNQKTKLPADGGVRRSRSDSSLKLIWEQARENMSYHWLESLLPIQPDLTVRQFCQCWQSEETIVDKKSNSLVILALVGWPSRSRGKNMEGRIEFEANCRLILTTTYFALLNFEFWSKLPFMHHGTWIVC